MGLGASGAVAVISIFAVAFFFIVPVVYTPTPPPNQLAFIGPVPNYQSISCVVLGLGSGLWRTYSFQSQGTSYLEWSYQWSYTLGCYPPS
ncbi:MAG: hypothetical protein HY296_01605 [Thaumarchaeota archaeon]|nr:hypothetical protein [Nitrososphaerota archaeon]